MIHIDVFDPPLCCPSGVCGPGVDPLLAAFAADVDWLVSQGVSVSRYNPAQDPQAFAVHPVVSVMLKQKGTACLPLVLVDGEVIGEGAYPRRDELAARAGLAAAASATKPRIRLSASGGCKPDSGCCS